MVLRLLRSLGLQSQGIDKNLLHFNLSRLARRVGLGIPEGAL